MQMKYPHHSPHPRCKWPEFISPLSIDACYLVMPTALYSPLRAGAPIPMVPLKVWN